MVPSVRLVLGMKTGASARIAKEQSKKGNKNCTSHYGAEFATSSMKSILVLHVKVWKMEGEGRRRGEEKCHFGLFVATKPRLDVLTKNDSIVRRGEHLSLYCTRT